MELIRGQVLAHTSSEEGGGADMRASFHCTMTLAFPNGKKVTATDVLNGKLVWPPRGDVTPGSGFYSLFVAEGEAQTLQVPCRGRHSTWKTEKVKIDTDFTKLLCRR